MSGLSYLNGYVSEDSDCELEPSRKRQKLPPPNLTLVSVVASDVHEDNPQDHDNRVRSFPHIRGNWATFVYISYKPTDCFTTLLAEIQKEVLTKIESCHMCDDFHISLSRTFVLKYHLISPFREALLEVFKNVKSFNLFFGSLKVFCNEEKSRTFVSIEVDTQKYLQELTEKIDQVLTDFQLPIFYEDPSFHMSILWVNGDKTVDLNESLASLNSILCKGVENTDLSLSVDTVSCKSGNKYFQYTLQ